VTGSIRSVFDVGVVKSVGDNAVLPPSHYMANLHGYAEEQFRLETGIQPGSAEAFYRLGEALLQLGKFHEAREALGHSDQLREDMPETLYQLGKAAAMDGDDIMAQKCWQHLLILEKDTPLAAQAHFGLSGIYRKLGKPADADREMDKFRTLQSKPDHTDLSPN
jgi:tetratricopeptide (TPR) repeat protein